MYLYTLDKTKLVMDTLLIEYSVRSEIISKILQAFSRLIGASVKHAYVPTEEEKAAIEKSLKSGICTTDISELKKLLRS